MIEEAVVHIGMHKTGSSSIQAAYSGDQLGNVVYLDLPSANHSGFPFALLSKYPHRRARYIRDGYDKQEIARRQAECRSEFVRKMSDVFNCCEKVIISGEVLSPPRQIGQEEIEYLKEILGKYCKRVRIIGYVRPPVSFMQSAFQQRLKAGARGLDVGALYPHYRARFEKFDKVFGRQNVELVPFHRDALHGGDVVKDFGYRIGVEVGDSRRIQANQSLSLEATALLFVARQFGPKGSYKGFARDESERITLLSRIGKERLAFAPSLVAPILDKNRNDIEWMTQRLGTSIVDAPPTSGRTIASEADLIEIACKQKDELWRLIQQSLKVPPGLAGVAELVDHIHAICASGARVPVRRGQKGWLKKLDALNLADNNLTPAQLLRRLANALAELEPDIAASLRFAANNAEKNRALASGRAPRAV